MSVDFKEAVKAGAHNYFIFMWNPSHPENPRMKNFQPKTYINLDTGEQFIVNNPQRFEWCKTVINKIEYIHRGVSDSILRAWREQQQALRTKAPLVAAPVEAEAIPV